jgi:SAM-dependent methyltransferase
VPRRSQLIPWRVAGRVTDQQQSADEVVQTTGWVFNNETGDALTLADFVASGDDEVALYLSAFGLAGNDDGDDGDDDGGDGGSAGSIVEIGSGIGRMTCAFTRRFGTVYACDLDAGFLERCREAVGRFGRIERLRTVAVPDGRSLDVGDGVADVVFSYITLQHCSREDALALVAESIRVLKPGGILALNFRSRTWADMAVLPAGAVVRGLLNVPVLGDQLSRRRTPARLAWQVNRLDPHHVLQPLGAGLTDVAIWRNPARDAPVWGADGADLEYLGAVNRAHWWLVARTRTGDG